MITVTAPTMLAAQGVELAPEQRAELVERCDRMRRIITAATGYVCTDKQSILVNVYDLAGCRIGYLTYWL